MKVKLKTKEIKSAGKVSMKHFDENGNILGERDFNNLLTDAYFAQNTFSPTAHIQIGTGTAPPEVTDTSLENFHQGVTSSNNKWTSLTPFSGPAETATKINRNTRSATFNFSSPVTITEVGLGSTTTGGVLYARSLIKDEDGIPNPFQMEEGHQLSVSYAIEMELPLQLTEVATIASPWPAPYDGDISVAIVTRADRLATSHTSLSSISSSFVDPVVNVNRALGSITYTLNRSTAFSTSDAPLTPQLSYNTNIGGLTFYSYKILSGDNYSIVFRQERDGTDKRVLVPANHNFSIEFETGIDWGRKP